MTAESVARVGPVVGPAALAGSVVTPCWSVTAAMGAPAVLVISMVAPAVTAAVVAMAANSAVTAVTADPVRRAVSVVVPGVPAGLVGTRSRSETAVAAVMAGSEELVPAVGPVDGEVTPQLSVTAAMVVPAVTAALPPRMERPGPAGLAALVGPAVWTVAMVVPVAMAAAVVSGRRAAAVVVAR